MIIDSVENPWRITKETIEVLAIFLAMMNNEAVVIAAKDRRRVFTSNLCFRPMRSSSGYRKIESNHFININMTSDNLEKEIPDFFHSYMLSIVVTQHPKNLNLRRSMFSKKFVEISSYSL